MEVLILRFDAPLMSFGGVLVDQHGPTERFPGLSMLTGLCGNALGFRHRDAAALESLQSRIEYAARWDVTPELVIDYHTVDLGQNKMAVPGWTTRGQPEHRAGSPDAKLGTHQRYRHYWANGVMTVSLTLLGNDSPDVRTLATALQRPARPLFIGRKSCLPSGPVLSDIVDFPDVLTALRKLPLAARPKAPPPGESVEACWPAHLDSKLPGRESAVYDRRDWLNQTVAGRRVQLQGRIIMELSP